MSEIRLYPQDDGGLTIPNASGPSVYLPQFRLRAWVRLAGEYAQRQAVVDTGAPACILTKPIWLPLHQRGRITWLGDSPDVPGKGLPEVLILQGRYPFRLGRITVELVDLDKGRLAPVSALVQCIEDHTDPAATPLPRLLILGLADLLLGRTLTLTASTDGRSWTGAISE